MVKISPLQQSTLMSTMVGPAPKPHWPSWGQAMHLPNLATILLEPCWSGIVKKWKEKVSFSIRKWPTSWRHRIEAKNTWKTYFWLNSPFKGCNQPHMLLFASVDGSAKEWQKRVNSYWVSDVFIGKNDGMKNLKKQQSNLHSDSKNSPQSLSNMKKTFFNLR